jgi:hypothetical protein
MADPKFPDLPISDRAFADRVFEYVQFLLDDDSNLTPTGNLAAEGRRLLRRRVEELLEGAEGSPATTLEGIEGAEELEQAAGGSGGAA